MMMGQKKINVSINLRVNELKYRKVEKKKRKKKCVKTLAKHKIMVSQ